MGTDVTTLDRRRYLIAPELLLDDMTLRSGWAAVVDGGRFTAVGPHPQLASAHPDLPVVAAPGRLLMPGLVDAHHHLTQAFGTAYAFG